MRDFNWMVKHLVSLRASLSLLLTMSLVIKASDEPELLLTPWWNMELADGEMLQLDCGVPGQGKLEWYSGGEPLKTNERQQVETRNVSDFMVATLTVREVQLTDSRTYTCRYSSLEEKIVAKNVSVVVLPGDKRQNFEKEHLNNWMIRGWTRRTTSDPDVMSRNFGPKFDRTYGASKDIGSFLEVNTKGLIKTTTATITSPEYPASTDPTQKQCLYFWYAFDSKKAELKINVVSTNRTDEEYTVYHIKENRRVTQWKKASVEITEDQRRDEAYKLEIQAVLCENQEQRTNPEGCEEGIVALDDIKVVETSCESDDFDWPNINLRYRLSGGEQPWQGRLEVLHEGYYGSVCSRDGGLGTPENTVLCHGLNFSYTDGTMEDMTKINRASLSEDGVVWLSGVHCDSNDTTLDGCLQGSHMWGETGNCTHEEDVFVFCSGPKTAPKPTPGGEVASQPTPTTPPTTMSSTTSTKLQTTTTTTTISGTTISTPPFTTTAETSSTSAATQIPQSTSSSTPAPASETTTSTVPPTNSSSFFPGSGILLGGSHTRRIGKGILLGLIIIILMTIAVCVLILFKGRKRRRKSKYLNFGSTNYSQEHLPTNDFHLQSPLTMSSMGYTVLA